MAAIGPPLPGADVGSPPAPALRPGTRVVGVTRFGAFASHQHLDARYLRPFPDDWRCAAVLLSTAGVERVL